MTALAFVGWVTARKDHHVVVEKHKAYNKEELTLIVAESVADLQRRGATSIDIEYGEISKMTTLELKWVEQ